MTFISFNGVRSNENDASNLKQLKTADVARALQSKTSNPTTEKVNSVVVERLQPLKHRILLYRDQMCFCMIL